MVESVKENFISQIKIVEIKKGIMGKPSVTITWKTNLNDIGERRTLNVGDTITHVQSINGNAITIACSIPEYAHYRVNVDRVKKDHYERDILVYGKPGVEKYPKDKWYEIMRTNINDKKKRIK